MDAAHTLLARYAGLFAQHWYLWALAVLLPLAAQRVWQRWPQLQAASPIWNSPAAQSALRAIAWAGCVLWAVQLAWLCDDAFITFRYAANWAAGHGPVWNIGERVEGYTDFLWMSLLAGAIRLGLDPGQCALAVSLASFVTIMFMLDRWLGQLSPALPANLRWFVSAALGLQYSFASFASSGLETMFAACLLVIALERANSGALLSAGFAGIAAALAHPDHLIFYCGLGLALALDPELRRQRTGLVRYVLPLLLLFVPYVFWRVHYYGDWFPNTFYAKSADQTYFTQGVLYLATALLFGGLIWIAPFAALGFWRTRASLLGRFVALGVAPYLVYVAKVGGDYMYGRLLISILPIVYACAALGAHAARRYSLALGAFALTAIPVSPVPPQRVELNMSDERTFTKLVSFAPIVVASPMYWRAQLFRELFAHEGAPKPVLADTEIGMLGYYSQLVVIDCLGLTDRHVAHQPIAQRGRPGHEKEAELSYLRQRHVTLSRWSLYPGYEPLTRIQLPTLGDYHIGRWDPEVMRALRQVRDLQQSDFLGFLDNYLNQLDAVPTARVQSHWQNFLQPFYFEANHDPARRDRLEAYLAMRL